MNTLEQGALHTMPIRDELFPLLSPELISKIGAFEAVQTCGDNFKVCFVGYLSLISELDAGMKKLAKRLEDFNSTYAILGHLKNGFIRFDLNVFDLSSPPKTLLLGYLAVSYEDAAKYDATIAQVNFEKQALHG